MSPIGVELREEGDGDLDCSGVSIAFRISRVLVPAPGLGTLAFRESRDIRVTPELRGKGIGATLITAAEQWARSRGCTELKVETQNINVDACRFYEKSGFELRAVDPTVPRPRRDPDAMVQTDRMMTHAKRSLAS